MSDLDRLLGAMRSVPVDPRLAGMEQAVMAGMATRRGKALVARRLALASAVAIGVGTFSGVMTDFGPQPGAKPDVWGMSAYAPSRLLG